MARRISTYLPLLLSFLMLACSQQEQPPAERTAPANVQPALTLPAVDGARAMNEVVSFVTLGPRVSGTTGAALAAGHIAKRLEEFGYEPIIDAFTNDTPGGPVIFRNVHAFKPGPQGRTVILASHYDTRANISETFAGANDSGSSTGLLLELARILKTVESLGIGVGFAFFDGEECVQEYGKTDGLHGSRRLATQLALKEGHPFGEPCAIIVLDMIGDQNLNVSLPGNTTPALASLILKAAHQEGVRPLFSLSASHMIDDHVPFTKIGLPAVDLIDFEFGSAPGLNDYWHTDEDSLDKLSSESLAIIGRVTLRSIDLIRLSDL